ncbi:MAG: hypothetical protein ACI37Z_07970 [Candidatus Gastranaerophilaceae bacterium]
MEIKIEYFENTKNPDKIGYAIKFGRKIVAAIELDKEKISYKSFIAHKIMFAERFCQKHPNIERRKVLAAFAALDEAMKIYYEQEFPNEKPIERKEKREELRLIVTKDEKEALIKFLEEYRSNKKISD